MKKYIPVKIQYFENGYVICNGITNYKPFTKYRYINKVKIGTFRIGRNIFKKKYIYRGKVYIIIINDKNEYRFCNNKEINKWGEWLYKEYEKTLNNIFNGKFKNSFINDL